VCYLGLSVIELGLGLGQGISLIIHFFSSSVSFEIFTAGTRVSGAAPLATDWLPTASLVHGLIIRFVQAAASSASLRVIKKLFWVNSGPGDFQVDPPPFRVAVAPFSTMREIIRTIPLSNRICHFLSLRFLPLHEPWTHSPLSRV
jgi:hypothetical protein